MQRILLIELSATLRHAAARLLDKYGFEVSALRDFATAVAAVREDADFAEHYSAVVLGWPSKTDDDADELLALLAQPEHPRLPVLILAHEADAAKLDWVARRARSALLLWDDYREAVPSLKKLVHEIPTPARPEIAKPESGTAVRLLLVDDSPTVRVSYRKLLTRHGYEVETAAGVAEAMDKAVSGNFDIAIIDYFMPDGTGDQLCRQLRDDPRTAHITTAIVTGAYLDRAITDSLQAGAIECMFKNESTDLFLARLDAMSRTIGVMKATEQDRERLEGILSSVGDGVYGVDNDGLITFTNPAAKEILGCRPGQSLIGQSPYALFHHMRPDGSPMPRSQCPLLRAYGKGEQLRSWETTFIHTSGRLIPVECTVFPLHIDGKLEGSVIAFRDISERKLLEEELKWQATHDPLTKLPNRNYFEEQLAQEVKGLQRTDGYSALLYLDLDQFKYLNDTAGHSAGDQLLVEVGHQLRARLRGSDTLARIGGDEFAIILRNINEDSTFDAADVFRSVLENYRFNYEGKSYKINVSVGIAPMSKELKSHGEALANADLACHIAKGKGRNNSHLFSSGNDEKAAMDLELGWSARLHDALAQNQFVLHYQPIAPLNLIDVDNLPVDEGMLWRQLTRAYPKEVLYYEVLLRLPDARGMFISPDAFLPTAERFNMMPEIDRWVIAAATKMLADTRQYGANIKLSLNLSGQTLEDRKLVEFIKALTDRYRVDPACFVFEITETTAVSNLQSANRLIDELRDLGCAFALDDFGSGFCSFSHLKYLPADIIKIDGIFVQGMLNDPIDRAIVSSIVEIAHSVGKKTVAEYAEHPEILRMLKKSGVDYVQGYYISCAKPEVDTFSEIIRPMIVRNVSGLSYKHR